MPICSCVQYVCSGQVHLKSVQNLLEKVTPHFKVSPTNEREGGVGWGGAIGRVTRLIFLVEIKAKSSLFGVKIGGKPCCD